ncbi:hypothetical protein [Bailinhaonella thermotolerans]|uniref:Uncharacterized protein n=1 Tax=Bailinhaonella thermotolerans TaxID=1070861 RepID=A0A3A4A166_9ACTN|nr:hypothetical protein [Bailinhaonella thermotolerans]RJL20783.1 hypothetical protein D5H75_38640 [Bailinhaonella thermotolerans]
MRLVEILADRLLGLLIPAIRAEAAVCTWGNTCKCVPTGSGWRYRWRYCTWPDNTSTTTCEYYSRGC